MSSSSEFIFFEIFYHMENEKIKNRIIFVLTYTLQADDLAVSSGNYKTNLFNSFTGKSEPKNIYHS